MEVILTVEGFRMLSAEQACEEEDLFNLLL